MYYYCQNSGLHVTCRRYKIDVCKIYNFGPSLVYRLGHPVGKGGGGFKRAATLPKNNRITILVIPDYNLNLTNPFSSVLIWSDYSSDNFIVTVAKS